MGRKHIIVFVLVSSLLLFGLAFYAHQYPYFSFDYQITRAMQSIKNPFWDSFWGFVSWPGYPPVVYYLTVSLILFLFLIKWKIEAVFETIAIFLQSVLGYSLKFSVDRPRASADLIKVVHVGLEGGKFSFPAGHVESYVALFGFLAVCIFLKLKNPILKKALILFLLFFLIFIGPSRVYMGEHWASDVVGGYLVGFIVLSVTYMGYTFVLEKYGSANKKSSKI